MTFYQMAKVSLFLAFIVILDVYVSYVFFAPVKEILPKIIYPAGDSNPTANYTVPPPLSSCPIPKLDPLDPRSMYYFTGYRDRSCISQMPDLVHKTSQFELSVDHRMMKELRVEYCAYQEIERDDKDDESLKYSPEKRFKGKVKINSLVAKVMCYKKRHVLYENIFYFIKKVNKKKRSNDTLNVVIFFVESLSNLASYRLFPRTQQFMKTVLKSHVFQYHIKTGVNTLPNLSAAMTGKRSFKHKEKGKTYPAELPTCTTDECIDGFIDDWPFVWKDFAKVGYVTALAELDTIRSAWNFMMKGFKHAPVNHYMRPFRLAWERTRKQQTVMSMTECVVNTPYYQKVLEWSEEVIRLNKDQPLFGFFSVADGHENNFPYKRLDLSFTKKLTSLFKEGLFNNSIVIFMSDHGLRTGYYRSTWMGRMEDSMPLFSLSLPPWFKDKYPEVDAALDYNTRRLTTWYDVHAMLEDVVHQRFEGGTHQKMQRGMSLFKMIQHNRTCEDAEVPLMYCPCRQQKRLSITSDFVDEAGKKVVEHLNYQLRDYRESCAELKFSHITMAHALLDAEVNVPPANWSVSPVSDLRVVVMAEPSKGLYEATLVYEATNSSHQVESRVSRLDRYKGQSGCIKHAILEAFCYCKNKQS